MKIQKALEEKLTIGLSPLILKIINESPNHNVPPDAESHFRVLLVSDQFKGLSSVKRHQMVYKLIAKELETVHAFSQNTFTSEEWTQQGGALPESPPCQKKKPS